MFSFICEFWVSVRRIFTIEAVNFPETPRKNLPGRVTFVFPKQLSTLTLKNRSSGRMVFHIFHRSYPLLSVRSDFVAFISQINIIIHHRLKALVFQGVKDFVHGSSV